jgi:hypothetical protein
MGEIMNVITCLHKPQWNLVGDEWQMFVGNRLAAKIAPNVDKICSEYVWLTLIE